MSEFLEQTDPYGDISPEAIRDGVYLGVVEHWRRYNSEGGLGDSATWDALLERTFRDMAAVSPDEAKDLCAMARLEAECLPNSSGQESASS
jgi:hypothetical protein